MTEVRKALLIIQNFPASSYLLYPYFPKLTCVLKNKH